MKLDVLTNNQLYSMQLYPSVNLHNGQGVWVNKEVTLVLKKQSYNYKLVAYHVREPLQLLIPYKEHVNEYVHSISDVVSKL